MGRMVEPAAHERATAILRRTAGATNLLLPSRRTAVIGGGPVASALRGMLAGLGVVPAGADKAGLVICTGESGPLNLAAIPRPPDGARVVVVDGSRESEGADGGERSERAEGDPGSDPPWPPGPRPGVVGVPGRPWLAAVPMAAPAALDPGREGPSAQESAAARIEWARQWMPVSAAVSAELAGRLAGLRIGVSLAIEPKTAVLALLLEQAGGKVILTAPAAETDAAVAETLAGLGVTVVVAATPAEDRARGLRFLDHAPHLLIDDGAHLTRLLHTDRPHLLADMIGATEETTSGVAPLSAMAAAGTLRLPVVAVNDARSKHRFDNRWGTGQSCVLAILDVLAGLPDGRTDLLGARVVVAGYGPVGEGVAAVARALGAEVLIAERDPVHALEAVFAGYRVAPLVQAVATADVVVSATGVADTIGLAVLRACAPGAVVAVAGGVPQEVAVDAARAVADRTTLAPHVERLVFGDGRGVLLLSDGGCINLTAGEGNPIDVMDLSFAVQLAAVAQLLDGSDGGGARLAPGLYPVSRADDERIGRLALTARGWTVDAPGASAPAPRAEPGGPG